MNNVQITPKQTGICLAVTLLVAGLLTAVDTKANRPKDPACVVLLGYAPSYVRGPDGIHRQDGLVVTWVEQSGGPEKVPVGSRVSDSVAYYMDLGLEPDVDSVYGIVRMRRK